MEKHRKQGIDLSEDTKDKRLLISCLLLIVAASVISAGLTAYLRLDKPVFAKHYCDYVMALRNDREWNGERPAAEWSEGQSDKRAEEQTLDLAEESFFYKDLEFNLYYFTDILDTRTVNDVFFPEAPDLDVTASEYSHMCPWSFTDQQVPGVGEQVGRYSMRVVLITLRNGRGEESSGDFELTRMVATFSDGTREEVNIGRLAIQADHNLEIQRLSSDSARSVSDGMNSECISPTEDLKFSGFDLGMLAAAEAGSYTLQINGIDYEKAVGTEYPADRSVDFSFAFNEPKDMADLYTVIELKPRFYFKNGAGETREYQIWDLNYNRFNSGGDFFDVVKYLKAREVK